MLFYKDLRSFIEGQKRKLEELVLSNLPERGIILKVLVSDINKGKSDLAEYSVTSEAEQLEVNYLGLVGDRHHRAFRDSTGREKSLYPKGTKIREHRHIFVVSLYDCKFLSDKLGVEVTPELLGANIVIGGQDQKDFSLSKLPENAHLLIAPENSSEIPRPPIATLKHYTLQQGCGITGSAIAEKYNDKSLTKKFVDCAKDNRGVVCSVEYPVENPAIVKPGQVVYFKFPIGITP